MEEKYFVNKTGDNIYYLEWRVEDPKAAVVISHGMAEHPERYDDFANFLNRNNVADTPAFGHNKKSRICGGISSFDCVS